MKWYRSALCLPFSPLSTATPKAPEPSEGSNSFGSSRLRFQRAIPLVDIGEIACVGTNSFRIVGFCPVGRIAENGRRMLPGIFVSPAYGAAASLITLLLWIYYSAQILLFGAEFTQVYANTYGGRVEPMKHAVKMEITEKVVSD
jgi:Virulence factor BrkB